MQERRKTTRTRSYLGGRMTYHHRSCTMDCLVRNVSDGGALLEFTDVGTVPDRFEVTVERQQRTLQARMIWRRGDRAGVSFLPEPQANVIPLETMRRIRELEAERVVLRRRVAQLSAEF
jgi:hypothetical protein